MIARRTIWGELTNQHGPEIDKYEESHIGELLERQNEGENVIRQALGESIQRMKSVARKRSRHDPFMMRFVQLFVDEGMVQAPVDPIDAQIGKAYEERKLNIVVERERSIRRRIV